MSKLYVGTSGWGYGHWQGFYPKDLPSHKYLAYYSRRFPTVEINYSFYHLPKEATFKRWADQTPEDFIFALKLSRFITHIRRLEGVEEAFERFLSNARALGPKLGPILVQLPPSFKAELDRLEDFLKLTSRVHRALKMERLLRLAFEVRHQSWFEPQAMAEAVQVLREYGSALVFAHSSRYPYPDGEPLSAGFVYLRFHGPEALFASRYGEEGLRPWAPKIVRWLKRGLEVYAYFNNDFGGYALEDAHSLMKLLGVSGLKPE